MPDLLAQLQECLGDHRYRVQRELGRGGMATVLLAHDLKHDRQVAIKVLRPELTAALGAERFLREIQTTASLRHPHILPLHDSGAAGGLLYYVMPFVEGGSLRDRLQRQKQLAVDEALTVAREVADALGYAHDRGLVHRDIKPENILLDHGHAVVTDFGIARAVTEAGADRLTETGISIGTPAYMSPEQSAGTHDVDARSDLYSLGCVLYEMLAGQPPFTAPTAQAFVARHALDPVPSLRTVRTTVPSGVERAVNRALAKVPADRFATAEQFAAALNAPSTTVEASAGRARRGSWRFPGRLIGGAAAALVLGVGLALWWSRWRSPAPRHGVERIALLPLANATGDSSQTFVADGLTREVISALTSSGVRVIGYASASHYAPDAPLEKVARELRVDAVAVGALRRTSPRLQVALELTDPVSHENLWAETFTADTSELSGMVSRAVQGLAGVVRGHGRRPRQTLHAGRPPPNQAAYTEFLLGRRGAGGYTPGAYRSTVDHYARAVAIDSAFAAAWAGLAGVHAVYASYFDWVPREAYDKAQAAAKRALSLDPTVGEAHLALALLKQSRDWDWIGAEQEFRRAIALQPSSTAYDNYAWFLVALGRFQEAIAADEKAVDIDPTDAVLHASLSALLREAGQLDRAVEEAWTGIKLDSTHAESWLSLAWSSAQVGRMQEASAAFDRYESLFGSERPLERAVLYAHAGRRGEARMLLSREEGRDRGEEPALYDAAKAHSLLGDREEALTLLESATNRREFWWPNFTVWDPIREDPRFRELVNRLGLPDAAYQ